MGERIAYPIFVDEQRDPSRIVLVKGWQVSEHFAARFDGAEWRLDHLPSGCFMSNTYRKRIDECATLAAELEPLASWEGYDLTAEEKDRIYVILCQRQWEYDDQARGGNR